MLHNRPLMTARVPSKSPSHRHLLGIEDLTREAIDVILARALAWLRNDKKDDTKVKGINSFAGCTLMNLFFETSTRTRTSFELAAKRLGISVSNLQLVDSAIKKGETLHDTAITLDAMQPDVLVIRHPFSGAVRGLADRLSCVVINAGDGRHEHPTQALLDACTMIQHKKSIKNLRVAMCGDIKHSRVARSNIHLLKKMGASLHLIAPPPLMPSHSEQWGVKCFYDIKEGIRDCDIVMMLRLQKERIERGVIPSRKEYFRFYGLTQEHFSVAAKGALIMHPGPINRGLEIDGGLAHDINHSVIQSQVRNGVAVRMACIEWAMGALS